MYDFFLWLSQNLAITLQVIKYRKGEPLKNYITFLDVDLEVKQSHFCHILLVKYKLLRLATSQGKKYILPLDKNAVKEMEGNFKPPNTTTNAHKLLNSPYTQHTLTLPQNSPKFSPFTGSDRCLKTSESNPDRDVDEASYL